ncbi:hypothetical protein PV08_00270 [Exophiala spinifera]|uniref:Uncharacterized protein n=1 Tax=Exophiala spinifera TaxID=91928 RepID=A0A0D1YWL5_9EURO|nr:uncharacterized protein PV08_00270 [Exophiala spinifera]KIW19696.1 hypothetical protein PV08_00270 [Exophiala spinifera]
MASLTLSISDVEATTLTTTAAATTAAAQASKVEVNLYRSAHLTPHLDHSHALGSTYPSSCATASRIINDLRRSQLPKAQSGLVRLIRAVHLFIALASKEWCKHTTDGNHCNGKTTPCHDEVGSSDDVHGEDETDNGATHGIDEARLIFMVKNSAVLQSIKIRVEIQRAFEEYCAMHDDEELDEKDGDGDGDGDHDGDTNDLIELPSTKHIRLEAQSLLGEFARNPLPDLADLLRGRSC